MCPPHHYLDLKSELKQWPLEEAMSIMQTVNIDEAPVLKSKTDPTLAGVITLPYTKIRLSREILKRQGEVDKA